MGRAMSGPGVEAGAARRMSVDAEVDSVRRAYAGQLWPDALVEVFKDPTRAFATHVVRRGARVRPLPAGAPLPREITILSQGVRYDLVDYISRNRVAGLLILNDGKSVLEHYQSGNDARTRWLSMSVAKSISTTLVGAAAHGGHPQRGADRNMCRSWPAADGGSLRSPRPANDTSVPLDDTHTDENSERRRMLELQFSQRPGALLRYIAGSPRVYVPGTSGGTTAPAGHAYRRRAAACGGGSPLSGLPVRSHLVPLPAWRLTPRGGSRHQRPRGGRQIRRHAA